MYSSAFIAIMIHINILISVAPSHATDFQLVSCFIVYFCNQSCTVEKCLLHTQEVAVSIDIDSDFWETT